MFRIGLAAGITAIACFAISATIGLGARSASSAKVVTVAPGDGVSMSSLDLFCRLFPTDPDHHDAGPVFACFRQSTKKGAPPPAAMEATRTHMRISKAGASVWAFTVNRAP
jgi:hypothetical protein